MEIPVDRIVIESAYGPKIVLQDPFAPSDPSAPPSTFLPQMKPSVQLYLRGSKTPIKYEPYGPPGETKWPLVRNSLIGAGALLAYLLYRGIRY